ncbi:diguanylate cyclase [Pleurocapsales cyanobacterium LEGE 10410]|nr:diguanylate cyclase [Pleurocapsales cyanobacterium LEGE 10410]
MPILFNKLHILQTSFLFEPNYYLILTAFAYYLIAFSLSYSVHHQEYLNTKLLYNLLSLFFGFSGTYYLLKSEWIKFIEFNSIEQYDLQLKAIIAIGLGCALCGVTIFQDKKIKLSLRNNKLESLEKQLNQETTAKIAAETKVAKLLAELEQKVLERTTALVSANQDLRETTTLMEKVANLTPNILYVYDLEKKCNVYSNRFVGEILGYSVSEIEEMNVQLFDKLLHPDDVDLVRQHHQDCLVLGQDDFIEFEYRMQDRHGNWHWLHSKDTVFERNVLGQPTQILGITQDITETKRIQSEAARLNLELAEKVETLEKWHRERIKLAKMNEFLQACLTIHEAQTALTDLLQPLFPHTHGAVYLINNSKNLLNAIAVWGLAHSEGSFEPHDCWALRRGNVHQAHPITPGLYCAHVNSEISVTPTLCLPMIAKGKTLGMLYLRFDRAESISDLVRELAETVAQNIAMSFANLRLQEELRHQSLRDPLTGLYNRRYLQECLTKEIDRAHRKGQFISIIMLDIDHFKRFNDVHGHSAGDLVLKEVGAYLISQTRQYDIACRYGGEEMVIVMSDASLEDSVMRAEEIRSGVKKLNLEHEGEKLESISVSIGISCFPDDSTDADSLIRAADKALYQAKEQGRDCVRRC